MLSNSDRDKQKQFKLLFDTYYHSMCLYGLKFIDSLDVVEDLVQDVFAKCLGNQIDFTHPQKYLLRAIKNKCVNYLKSQKKLKRITLNENATDHILIAVEENDHLENKIRHINNLIETLPPATRQVFDCIIIQEMSYKEAAEELELSLNTIKTQIKRARRILRESSF